MSPNRPSSPGFANAAGSAVAAKSPIMAAGAQAEPFHSNAHFAITFHSDTDRSFGAKMGSVIFESCIGLNTEMNVSFIGDAQSSMSLRAVRSHQITGKISFGKTIQGGNSEFARWLLDVLDPNKRLKRMNLLIVIKSIDHADQVLGKWTVKNAWPCAWNGPLLDSGNASLALETITFVHEGVFPVLD
jgi:phage tail-like protein